MLPHAVLGSLDVYKKLSLWASHDFHETLFAFIRSGKSEAKTVCSTFDGTFLAFLFALFFFSSHVTRRPVVVTEWVNEGLVKNEAKQIKITERWKELAFPHHVCLSSVINSSPRKTAVVDARGLKRWQKITLSDSCRQGRKLQQRVVRSLMKERAESMLIRI